MSSKNSLRNRLAFQLLSNLDPRERTAFGKYLRSEYHHPRKPKRKALIEVFHRAMETRVWERDISKVDFAAGTGMDISTNAFDKLLAAFHEKLDEFCALQAFKENRPAMDLYGLRYRREHGVNPSDIDRKWTQAQKMLQQSAPDDAYFAQAAELELERALLRGNRLLANDSKPFWNLHLHLDRYYFIRKLRFLCATANLSYMFPESETPAHLDETEKWLSSFEEPPLIGQMYFHAYHFLSGRDSELHFQTLSQLFEQHEGSMTDETRAEVCGYLINHCTRRVNAGDIAYLPFLDQAYGLLIQAGLGMENGKLRHEIFKNMISVRARNGDTARARELWEEYGDSLNEDFDGLAQTYNLAFIEFHEGRLPEAVAKFEKLLERAPALRPDEFYGMDIRCLLLKAYFESMLEADMEQWDTLEKKSANQIRALQSFIDRRNLSEVRKAGYETWRRLITRLFQIMFTTEPEEQENACTAFRAELLSEKPISDMSWFLEMISRIQTHR